MTIPTEATIIDAKIAELLVEEIFDSVHFIGSRLDAERLLKRLVEVNGKHLNLLPAKAAAA